MNFVKGCKLLDSKKEDVEHYGKKEKKYFCKSDKSCYLGHASCHRRFGLTDSSNCFKIKLDK